MTIKEFIEAAIGREVYDIHPQDMVAEYEEIFNVSRYAIKLDHGNVIRRIDIHTLVLSPEAWKAVGKVKGWLSYIGSHDGTTTFYTEAQSNMVKMVHALFNGKTLEEYIATL